MLRVARPDVNVPSGVYREVCLEHWKRPSLGSQRTAAFSWGRYGITVNAVHPAIWTPMYQDFRDRMTEDEQRAHDAVQAQRIPLRGRLGDPELDFAPVMVFLASDGARFITGQILAVNGGGQMVR